MHTPLKSLQLHTQAKIAVCPGNTKDGDVSKCPFIRAKFALEDLPTFLGGKCRVSSSARRLLRAEDLKRSVKHCWLEYSGLAREPKLYYTEVS